MRNASARPSSTRQWSRALWSLAWPGWSQWRQHRPLMAVIFSGLVIATLVWMGQDVLAGVGLQGSTLANVAVTGWAVVDAGVEEWRRPAPTVGA